MDSEEEEEQTALVCDNGKFDKKQQKDNHIIVFNRLIKWNFRPEFGDISAIL